MYVRMMGTDGRKDVNFREWRANSIDLQACPPANHCSQLFRSKNSKFAALPLTLANLANRCPRGTRALSSRQPATMSPPPPKSSKGKSIHVLTTRSSALRCGVASVRHRSRGGGRNVSCVMEKCLNPLVADTLTTSSLLSPPHLDLSHSHHLRLGRYHLPLDVRGSVQGRYLFRSPPSRKFLIVFQVMSVRTAIFHPKSSYIRKFSCPYIFQCSRAWRHSVKSAGSSKIMRHPTLK
jgi:hypothetical protein